MPRPAIVSRENGDDGDDGDDDPCGHGGAKCSGPS